MCQGHQHFVVAEADSGLEMEDDMRYSFAFFVSATCALVALRRMFVGHVGRAGESWRLLR